MNVSFREVVSVFQFQFHFGLRIVVSITTSGVAGSNSNGVVAHFTDYPVDNGIALLLVVLFQTGST